MKRPKYWVPFVPYGCVNCGSKMGSSKKSSSLNGWAIKRGPKISTAIKLEGGWEGLGLYGPAIKRRTFF